MRSESWCSHHCFVHTSELAQSLGFLMSWPRCPVEGSDEDPTVLSLECRTQVVSSCTHQDRAHCFMLAAVRSASCLRLPPLRGGGAGIRGRCSASQTSWQTYTALSPSLRQTSGCAAHNLALLSFSITTLSCAVQRRKLAVRTRFHHANAQGVLGL